MIKKIISGGQTGADQAAIDVAINLGIPYGGWLPRGRKTEKGPLPDKYLLQELPDSSYSKRTEKNVINSDGTLIMSHGKLTGGSELTREIAKKNDRKYTKLPEKSLKPFYILILSISRCLIHFLLLTATTYPNPTFPGQLTGQ
jgi:hypothetical protein